MRGNNWNKKLTGGECNVARRVIKPEEIRRARELLQLDPDFQPALAATMRELRLEHGLTLGQIAAFVGLTGRQAVAGWELGQVPELQTLCVVADFFGVTVDYMLGREGAPRDSPAVAKGKAALHKRCRQEDWSGMTPAQRIARIWAISQEVSPTAFPPRRYAGLLGGLRPEVFSDLMRGERRISDVLQNRFAYALGIPESLIRSGVWDNERGAG